MEEHFYMSYYSFSFEIHVKNTPKNNSIQQCQKVQNYLKKNSLAVKL